MIFEYGTWLIPAQNRKEHLQTMEAVYANIRSKRQQFSSLHSSRFYTTDPGSGHSVERWIYLDSYDSLQEYKEFQQKLLNDVEAANLRAKWETLIVKDSFRNEVWTEFQRHLWVE